MKPDRKGLQSWYREAMLKRIDELVSLRDAVAQGSASACDDLRSIGQALRGSGATFGFPELSVAASKVETAADRQASRRLEGLLVELRQLVEERRGEDGRVYEWLAVCAGIDTTDWTPGADHFAAVWRRVRDEAGLSDAELAEAVADRFGLEVADLIEPSRSARRLVPEAFMSAQNVVPLSEESTLITVASADPVSLPTELELERLTGRQPVFAVAAPRALDAVLDAMSSGASTRAAAVSPGAAGEPHAEVGDVSEKDDVGHGGDVPEAPRSDTLPAESRAPSDPAEVAPGGPIGVLVVDDEPSARLLVRTLLEKRGFDPVEAADGIEALEVIRQHHHIGLAVVDLNMPRMDGLELIWELRDAGPWSNLPVIVVTGERDEILETQIMEEGADDYIRKPLDPRLFLARVEATLRRAGHAVSA